MIRAGIIPVPLSSCSFYHHQAVVFKYWEFFYKKHVGSCLRWQDIEEMSWALLTMNK